MKDNRRWFYWIEAILAALIIILGMQMIGEKNSDKHPKIAVILPDSEDDQWSAFRYGLKMAAQDTGTELSILSTAEKLTAEEELALIRQEIEQGAQAVILQPVPGTDMEKQLKKLDKKIPLMLVKNTLTKDPDLSLLPVVEPDQEAMGRTLAEQLLKDYNGNLSGKTFGILMETEDTQALVRRKKAFEEALQGTGAAWIWTAFSSSPRTREQDLHSREPVDLVIALDDHSLTTAAETAASNDLHGALVYGIGNSTEAAYFLDNRIVECLIVPDEFSMGYQSMQETANNIGKHFRDMPYAAVTYDILRREDLYSEKNQEILFTMSQ